MFDLFNGSINSTCKDVIKRFRVNKKSNRYK